MGIRIFNRYRHSFQFRVFLALALVIFIFIPGTGYVGYLQARKVAENQMQQFTISMADQISNRVNLFLAQHTYNVKLIKSFIENHLVDPANEKELLRYFSLFKQGHPEFVNIYYGDEQGEFQMVPPQIPEVHTTYDPRVRPWYQGAIHSGDFHWADVYLFASTRKPGITVSTPVFDDNKVLRGVCGIDIDLSAFSRFLRGIDIGKQGVAYIFDNKKGYVIAHPGLVQLPWNLEHIDLLRTCLAELKRQNKSFGITSYRGEEYFTASTNYPDKDWTVGVTISVADYMQNLRFIKQTTFSLVVAGILLSSLLSYLLAMTIIRPLHTLQQGIERISRGDLDYKVAIEDPDIASELASSFNQMAFSLQKSLAELKQTYAELAEQEKLAAVGRMTAGIAHEIKNPLGVIQGSAQIVANRERPWEMREKAAHFIIAEVARLDKTLKSFLAFAKPVSPAFQETDMIRLLEETLSATEERFREDGYSFVRDYPPQVPLLQADADQIRQVFWNITLNAMQAMPDGGTVTVRVRVEQNPEIPEQEKGRISLGNPMAAVRDWLAVEVEDHGAGIAPENMDRIMDPFVSFRDDGIGLGLPIVAQIVKLHHGHLHIRSNEGEGTVFSLFFPCIIKE
jgi:signal transduction histidine kinase